MFLSTSLLLIVKVHSHKLTNKQILQNKLLASLIRRSECNSWICIFYSMSTTNPWSMLSTTKTFSVQKIWYLNKFLVLPAMNNSISSVNVLFTIYLLMVVSSPTIVLLCCPSQPLLTKQTSELLISAQCMHFQTSQQNLKNTSPSGHIPQDYTWPLNGLATSWCGINSIYNSPQFLIL